MHAVISYSLDKQLLEDEHHLGCEVRFRNKWGRYLFLTHAKKLWPKAFQ